MIIFYLFTGKGIRTIYENYKLNNLLNAKLQNNNTIN